MNADGLRSFWRALLRPLTWQPALPNPIAAVGISFLALAYLVWLSGATALRWRMPMVTHLFPLGLLAAVMFSGALRPAEDRFAGVGPADRAVTAVHALAARLAADPQGPCERDPAQLTEFLENSRSVAPLGYRRHGRLVAYSVVPRPGAGGAIRDVEPGDGPGTIYLACDAPGRRFWLSAVVTDSLPIGRASIVRDGVGRAIVVEGEVGR